MKRFILHISFIFICLYTYAVPAKPGIGLYGDEWFHYREHDSIYYLSPAIREALRAEIVAENMQHMYPKGPHRAMSAMQASFPTKGSMRSIVILINFSDLSFSTPNPKESFERMLNAPNYHDNHGTGSARDYFIATSMGQFQPTFDVYGPYTLSKPCAHYGSNGKKGNDTNARAMVKEACELANADGVDFAQYDANDDGYVDNVFIYYAGHNEAEGASENTIWPHRYVLNPTETFDKHQVYDYACTSELSGNRGTTMCGIGTFCHEFSHVLGLVDMYHTSQSGVYTVGSWDIMSQGSYNNNGRTPPTYTAFERFMVGWLTPTQLENANNYLLSPISTSNTAYLIADGKHNMNSDAPSPDEYWMIENRQPVGWDSIGLPGRGLLISHITYNATRWFSNTFNNSKPMGFDICEAYDASPNVSSGADTYPGTRNITNFIPQPNYGEKLFEQEVSSIAYVDKQDITFYYGSTEGMGFTVYPNKPNTIVTDMAEDTTIYHVCTLVVQGAQLSDSIIFTKPSTRFFEVSIDGETWTSDSLFIPVGNDTLITDTLYVRHAPTRICENKTAILHIGTKNKFQLSQVILSGYSQRPILINQVTPLPASDVSSYSFFANWKEETDAEFYYLTLYKEFPTPQINYQGLDLFDSPESIQSFGWNSNFSRLVANPHSEGTYAILFSNSDEYIQSEHYMSAITDVAFWLSHTYLSNNRNSRGEITLSVQNAQGWHDVTTISINPNSRERYYTYHFDAALNYERIKLTYHHIGGSGGITLDDIQVTTFGTIEYIYRGMEYPLKAPNNQAHLIHLEPATTYIYRLMCSEYKGCEEHYSELSEPQRVETKMGTTQTTRQFTITHEGQQWKAYFPIISDDHCTLYIYDTHGHLIQSSVVPNGVYWMDINTQGLTPNTVYVAKYSFGDKLKRKDLWAKFMY